MSMSRTAVAGILLLSALLLQGCGRKGALFMQQEPVNPAPAAQAQPEQSPAISNQTAPSQTEPKK